jgi:hypothetical protein
MIRCTSSSEKWDDALNEPPVPAAQSGCNGYDLDRVGRATLVQKQASNPKMLQAATESSAKAVEVDGAR